LNTVDKFQAIALVVGFFVFCFMARGTLLGWLEELVDLLRGRG
jgi:hypothetical protein